MVTRVGKTKPKNVNNRDFLRKFAVSNPRYCHRWLGIDHDEKVSSANETRYYTFFFFFWRWIFFNRKNVSYASTCNSVGVPFGMFIGSVCFVLLMSEQFNINYFRAAPGSGGLITMKSTKIKQRPTNSWNVHILSTCLTLYWIRMTMLCVSISIKLYTCIIIDLITL